jgi:glycosyltransferase involved in cell wall biosynthesis
VIYLDVTKTAVAGHSSGLVRMNTRLLAELGAAVKPCGWNEAARTAGRGDWFLTGELFSELERPGFRAFLEGRRCRAAAIYNDAIPMKHPRITWPHSVARHPDYLKTLSRLDRVWAISAASRDELLGYWRWIGADPVPPVDVLRLGADFVPDRARRRPVSARAPGDPVPKAQPEAAFLCVGILEPRKNQAFLLDVCEALWREGLQFSLDLVGRVNPVFGRSLAARVRESARRFPRLRHRGPVNDGELVRLYASATASVFPTIAEGCGLPVLESLWMGVPAVCSDLPVLLENADGGGCLPAAAGDPEAWKSALRRLVSDGRLRARLEAEAASRSLPVWADAARELLAGLTAS